MAWVVLLSFFFSVCFAESCDGIHFVIEDDAQLNQMVERARAEFLSSRPSLVSTLGATVLMPEKALDNTTIWKRGSYDAFELVYPASTVKLAYMAASIEWCHTHGRPSSCIDSHVRPMIKNSDNLQTGVVVDICSGAPNINLTSTADPLFQPWYNKRLWTQEYLNTNNLLGAQTVNVKTYPSNTGNSLWGAENVAREAYGSNYMCSQCAASLMLEVTQGGLYGRENNQIGNPGLYLGATEYMRGLLSHQAWAEDTSFGFGGVPPGTIIRNKIGVAYDNLNDIALLTLPSGQELIVAAYSTAYEADQPFPYDGSNLGSFLYFLFEQLQPLLDSSCQPPALTLTVDSLSFGMEGNWTLESTNDALGKVYRQTTEVTAQAFWDIKIPRSGLYEVVVWSPQSSSFSNAVIMTVHSSTGDYPFILSQQHYGGRWYKLGDFYFEQGTIPKLLSIQGNNETSVANAVKISMWPECNHSPGASCHDFSPTNPICRSD